MPLLPRLTAWLIPILLLALATHGPPSALSHAPEAPHVSTALLGTANGPFFDLGVVEEAERQRLEDERVELAAEEARQAGEKAAQEAARPTPYVLRSPPVAWDGSLHAHPFLVCTRKHESDSGDANGNGLHDAGYQAIGGGGAFRGAFQFLRSTWDSTANMAGRPDLVGVDPAEASVADQDAMAWALYQASGNGPWGGRC